MEHVAIKYSGEWDENLDMIEETRKALDESYNKWILGYLREQDEIERE